jgi:hypothetical protein
MPAAPAALHRMPHPAITSGRPRPPAGGLTVVTLDPDATRPLARQLRGAGLAVGAVQPWGSRAFRRIATDRTAALLDAAHSGQPELVRAVRALRHLGPVIVLADPGPDPTLPLRAGAVNLLHRDLPPAQLAARVAADLRWLRRRPDPRPPLAQVPPDAPILLPVLANLRGRICCHELCWLLGRPPVPLTRRALNDRLQRVLPALHDLGLTVRRDMGWGASGYTVLPADEHRTAGLVA